MSSNITNLRLFILVGLGKPIEMPIRMERFIPDQKTSKRTDELLLATPPTTAPTAARGAQGHQFVARTRALCKAPRAARVTRVSIPTRRGTVVRRQEHCSRPTADLIPFLFSTIRQGSAVPKIRIFPFPAGAALPERHLFIFSRAGLIVILFGIVPFKS
jgi:hypothetical protein